MKTAENAVKQIVVVTNTLPTYKRSFNRLVMILVLFIAVMFTDDNVRMVFKVADPKLLACMGLLCFYVVYKFRRDYQETNLETEVVEDLDADQGRINLSNGQIPLEIEQVNSFFVKSFAKLSSSIIDGSRKISSDKKTILQLEYFKVNDEITLYLKVLFGMGLLGTVMGLSKALVLVDAGEISATLGMAYAFSTTVLAMIAQIAILPINGKLRYKKRILIHTFFDIISRLEK